MKAKSFFDRDAIAIKSEDKKRRRQNVKKARMARTVNKRGVGYRNTNYIKYKGLFAKPFLLYVVVCCNYQ